MKAALPQPAWPAAPVPARRTNVLFVMIQMTGMGGSERLVLNLVNHLDRRRFAPSVAWFVGERPMQEFEELGIPLFYVPKRGGFDPSAMRQLAGIVKAHDIDVINAHHFMSCVYTLFAARIANRRRLIYTEHSEEDVRSATGKWKWFGRYMVHACDGLIGVSDRVSKTLESYLLAAPAKVKTIENGVDVQTLGQASPLTGHVRRQFDIQPGDVVIGHVANFRRNKNHMFLLRAFHEIARRRRGVKLLLVGQGFEGDPENSEPEVRAYVRGHGLTDVVKLAGYQKNVRDLFAVMDISCLVSYNEGLPLSLIEAMASGLPVVGTDIEGIRTVVETDVNGVLVQPDDVDGLARALERLIDNPAGRCAMGKRAQSLASSRYTLERCVAQTQEMLMPGPATHLRD